MNNEILRTAARDLFKVRTFPENNYKGVYFNGKTLRLTLDPTQSITELKYPEFYDVKITGKCLGECVWCYQDSKKEDTHYVDSIDKINSFFGSMDDNQRPFQVAIGGGEPTSHPDFLKILVAFDKLGITPNYTTNGMFIKDKVISIDKVISYTKMYCGGVAISCHPHLEKYWNNAAQLFTNEKIKLNFHIIISDKDSVDYFLKIYKKYSGSIDYFVLLPYIPQGRATKDKELDVDYLFSKLKEYEDIHDVAFGANFYPFLKEDNFCKVSLYEPEILSKYLDLKDMKIYPSSFSNEAIKKIEIS